MRIGKLLNIPTFFFALALTMVSTSCEKEPQLQTDDQDTVETYSIEDQFSDVEIFDADGSENARGYKSKRYDLSYRTLSKALKCTGLDEAVAAGGLTIYGPNDSAFRKLGLSSSNICNAFTREELTEILLYHVVGEPTRYPMPGCVSTLQGSPAQIQSIKRAFFPRYFINQANIFGKFVGGDNDFFLIDQVILPPADDIVGVAQGAEDFSILVQAVLAADPAVAQTLTDPSSTYTVFAPNNAAFAGLLTALGVADLDALIAAVGIEGLTTVLTYHVAEVCAFSNDLVDGMSITTLQGETIEVDLENGQLIDKTDSPKSLGPNLNILASNGVIHEISGVLLPQAVIDAL